MDADFVTFSHTSKNQLQMKNKIQLIYIQTQIYVQTNIFAAQAWGQ